MEKDFESKEGLSRRGFLASAGMLAAGAAVTGLTGCQPTSSSASASASGGSSGSSSAAVVDAHIAPGRRATPTLENAEPIPPEAPPAQWTAEADFVVVGTGGGGLAASLLSRQKGFSVITVEKNDVPGGATQHANVMGNRAGTGRDQIAKKYAFPEFPYNREYFMRATEPDYRYCANIELLANIAEAAGECIDWMQDNGADLVVNASGTSYQPSVVEEKKVHKALSARAHTNLFHKLGAEAGVKFFFNTTCTALIYDGSRVVGIKADGPNGDVYYKANKGVILCSGSMGNNPDMLKKYIPTAYKVAVMGGPMPYHTGECIRMAQGVGADMTGYDTWCAWESELDNDTGQWTYFWGIRMLTQLPWLNIDKMGKRCTFYERIEHSPNDPVFYQRRDIPYYQNGTDRARYQNQASRIDHRAYCIFDGKFEDYMWTISHPFGAERRPFTLEDSDKVVKQDLFNLDWRVDFQDALDDGRIKKADTIEGLAEQLGLEPEILKGSIDQWNDNCAKGVDSGTLYPYQKSFLNPIVEPPFYGVKMGVRIAKTFCGVRTDEYLRVLTSEGKKIPGLYANVMVAGGVFGETAFGTNVSTVSTHTLTWATGYLAAKTAMSDK